MSLRSQASQTAEERVELAKLRALVTAGCPLGAPEQNRLNFLAEQERRFSARPLKGDPDV